MIVDRNVVLEDAAYSVVKAENLDLSCDDIIPKREHFFRGARSRPLEDYGRY